MDFGSDFRGPTANSLMDSDNKRLPRMQVIVKSIENGLRDPPGIDHRTRFAQLNYRTNGSSKSILPSNP